MKFRLINWIIVLVVLSSLVSAGIVDSYATGEFGAPGFRGREDVLSFVARVFVGGDNLITGSQVQWRTAGTGAWTSFNSCIATVSSGVFDCYYVAGASSVVTSDSASYEIRLVSDANSLVETKSVSVIVDSLAPTVSGVDFKQDSNGLRVVYSLSDNACNSPACTNKCSSIRRIEIFENDALIDTVEAVNTACSISTETKFRPFGNPVFGGSMKTYKAKFYDGAGNSVDGGVSRSVFVDNYLPVVSEDSFKLVDSVSGRIVHGFESGVSRGVAGEVIVSDDIAVSKAVVEFYGTKYTAGCTLIGGSDYRCTWGSLGILDNANNVGGFFIDAYDKGGNVQRVFANYPIGVEKTGPALVDFRLSRDGKEVVVVGANPSNMVLTAKVREEYPGLGSVSLSVNGVAYSPNCADVGSGLYDCRVTLSNVVNSGSITVALSGSDLSGNIGSGTLTKTFNVDSSVPVVNYLGSEFRGSVSSSHESYLGASSKIIAEITESALDSALLSVNGVNPVLGVCDSVSNGKYLCSWNIGSFNHKDEVSLQVSVKDKAGNVGTRSSSMLVDKEAPKVSLVDVLSLDGDHRTAVHKAGDYLVIDVDAEDDSPLFIEYDFRGLGYSSVIVEECCEAVVDPIPVSFGADGSIGGVSGNIIIRIVDAVGNSVDASSVQVGGGISRSGSSLRLDALQPDDNFNPNFWTASVVSSSPNALDRLLATRTYQRIGFSINLNKIQSNSPVTIGDVILYSCSDERGIYSNQQVFNGQSANPVVMIELSQLNEDETLDLDESVVTCELGIISKNRNVVYKPEVEKVNLTVKYFSTPLGVVDDRVERKIEDAKKRFVGPDSDVGKVLGQLRQINNFAEGTCKTLGTIDKIRQVMLATEGIWDFFKGTGADYAACIQNEEFNKKFKDVVWADGNSFCKVVSCQSPLFGESKSNGLDFTGLLSGEVANGKKGGDYIDPKENLFAAIMTPPYPCIPGIVDGLEEFRQLECGYIDCLQSQVPLGIPIEACESSRAVGYCRYVVGDALEIFALVTPFTTMWNEWFTLAETAIQDPLSTVGLVSGFVCSASCSVSNTAHAGCVITRYASLVGSLANDLKSFGENQFKPAEDICSKI